MANTMTDHGAIPEWTMADRIRKARETQGYSQAELANVTGLSLKTVGNYEKGHTRPLKGSIKLIALATGVDRYWLLTGEAGGPDTPGDEVERPTYCETDRPRLRAA